MSHRLVVLLPLLAGALLVGGCITHSRTALPVAQAREIEHTWLRREYSLTPEWEARILGLDPERVSERDVREVLANTPAPRIIKIRGGVNVRGGVYPVHVRMLSFTKFLLGMGYPGLSLTNPVTGTYAYSCYVRGEVMAGLIAWFYEREGLRPMIVGHSQGGMQTVKVLHNLASPDPIRLWNPLTWRPEGGHEFTDPLTGERRPVNSLVLPYATAVGAGGITRVMPNQWEVLDKLRSIPDSVEEFTGFCKGRDLLGGDFLGYGEANHYHANGRARVRNVWLPSEYSHGAIPETEHLVKDPAMREWIQNYHPSPEPVSEPQLDVSFATDSKHILWAAEVWHAIKKHWVLELQRLIRAQQARRHDL